MKLLKTIWLKTLNLFGKSPNFTPSTDTNAERMRKHYASLTAQQAVLLDEYEELTKAYDEELNKNKTQEL